MNDGKLKVGSLFSGIGGIELGLERAGGFETAWFIEKEPYAQSILRKHWPTTTIYDDVTTINFASLPRIDVLTGGFPCQDISNAGKRAGIEGSRSGLWSYCVEAIRHCRPRIALFENVAALTQRGLDSVLADIASLGYDAEWHCIPAKAIGASHQRDRICIICYPDNNGQLTTKECRSSDEGSNSSEERSEQASESQGSSEQYEELANSKLCGCLDRQAEKQSTEGREYAQREPQPSGSDVANTDSISLQGKQPKEPDEKNREEQGKRQTRPQDSSSGGWWAVEPDVGRVAHGVPNRVDRIKCLGNAVVPQWAETIGRAIMRSMER